MPSSGVVLIWRRDGGRDRRPTPSRELRRSGARASVPAKLKPCCWRWRSSACFIKCRRTIARSPSDGSSFNSNGLAAKNSRTFSSQNPHQLRKIEGVTSLECVQKLDIDPHMLRCAPVSPADFLFRATLSMPWALRILLIFDPLRFLILCSGVRQKIIWIERKTRGLAHERVGDNQAHPKRAFSAKVRL